MQDFAQRFCVLGSLPSGKLMSFSRHACGSADYESIILMLCAVQNETAFCAQAIDEPGASIQAQNRDAASCRLTNPVSLHPLGSAHGGAYLLRDGILRRVNYRTNQRRCPIAGLARSQLLFEGFRPLKSGAVSCYAQRDMRNHNFPIQKLNDG